MQNFKVCNVKLWGRMWETDGVGTAVTEQDKAWKYTREGETNV